MRYVKAAIALFAVGTLTFLPSTAHAEWEGIKYGEPALFMGHDGECVGTWAARGCWRQDGDFWRTLDMASDGKRMGVHWEAPSVNREGMCVNKAGEGEIRDCDYEFSEGRRIIARVGVCDGTVNPCGRPGDGSGWHGWSAWYEFRA